MHIPPPGLMHLPAEAEFPGPLESYDSVRVST
jgi:hypothetical protein